MYTFINQLMENKYYYSKKIKLCIKTSFLEKTKIKQIQIKKRKWYNINKINIFYFYK